jgi:DNA-directed RNA polymerase subunit E'/Rpb7
MIPGEIKFDANATPPQWTDNGDQVIEKGTNIRIKIKGLRAELDKMFAIGTMKEVYPSICVLTSFVRSLFRRTILAHCKRKNLSHL